MWPWTKEGCDQGKSVKDPPCRRPSDLLSDTAQDKMVPRCSVGVDVSFSKTLHFGCPGLSILELKFSFRKLHYGSVIILRKVDVLWLLLLLCVDTVLGEEQMDEGFRGLSALEQPSGEALPAVVKGGLYCH